MLKIVDLLLQINSLTIRDVDGGDVFCDMCVCCSDFSRRIFV